ncbi:RNA polymerase sigma factor [Psychroflexus tropicus]|uniref:RNA polymerase sigma factor n=1 Tax=Psychroflexus tropicus TaxID=197345 RepID=UPI00047685A1|nr:sigma-70 family RNA polymerase sigma factor [Psychroflexus tropicus]
MRKKQEAEFLGLLEKHQNIVHKICRMYTYDEATHKDLFQEISIQLWKAYPKFRAESKFSTWMYRVSLNTAITLYRKKKRNVQTLPWESFDFKISAEDYDSTLDDNLKLMYAAIKELNDIDKALVLLYLEDKPYTEISETLGISEVNARVKMNRVKTKLKNILNP